MCVYICILNRTLKLYFYIEKQRRNFSLKLDKKWNASYILQFCSSIITYTISIKSTYLYRRIFLKILKNE